MAVKVVDFLKTLLNKAGANVDQDVIKAALATLPPDLELAEDVSTAIDNGLLSLSAAKNNHPEIKNHYTALALKGLDSELLNFIESEKLPEEIVTEINGEKSSYKRAVLIAKKVKELEGKKASAGDKDKDKYTTQIADLNKELREIKDREQGILAKHKDEIKDVKKSHHLGTLLNGYKTRFDDLDPQTKQTVLTNIINKNLGAKGAILTIDENDNLVLINKDGSNVFGEDHRPLNPKLFLDKVMADEKIIVVNDAGNTGNGSQSGQQNSNGQQRQQFFQNGNGHQPPVNNGNGGKKVNTALQALLNESQQALEASSASGVL